jgi:hypothetical protein
MSNTDAVAVAGGDGLGGYIDIEQQVIALVTLTMLVGIFQCL